ncbi:MAG TPA: glycosyltransferase [Candidatus Eisenbacteria bacterium]|nr:glycosyltransferase [Candidatus Eisenbacteria bacterium]
MTPALSLVISVYRQPRFLEWIFASLANQTFPDFEVMVADDGSGPEIAAVIAKAQATLPQPIRHVWHEDHGFRKTIIVNQAVTQTTAPYLVLIDGDCILHHRFLERHFARRRAGLALAGRRVMLDQAITAQLTTEDIRSRRIENPRFWWNHVRPEDRRNGLYLPILYGWRGTFTDRYTLLGCNFSLHRADFLRVNGYNERIVGRGMEDTNLRARLLNAGVRFKSLSQEAIEYHCYHDHVEVRHDEAAIDRWRNTSETWTPFGVVKSEAPPA